MTTSAHTPAVDVGMVAAIYEGERQSLLADQSTMQRQIDFLKRRDEAWRAQLGDTQARFDEEKAAIVQHFREQVAVARRQPPVQEPRARPAWRSPGRSARVPASPPPLPTAARNLRSPVPASASRSRYGTARGMSQLEAWTGGQAPLDESTSSAPGRGTVPLVLRHAALPLVPPAQQQPEVALGNPAAAAALKENRTLRHRLHNFEQATLRGRALSAERRGSGGADTGRVAKRGTKERSRSGRSSSRNRASRTPQRQGHTRVAAPSGSALEDTGESLPPTPAHPPHDRPSDSDEERGEGEHSPSAGTPSQSSARPTRRPPPPPQSPAIPLSSGRPGGRPGSSRSSDRSRGGSSSFHASVSAMVAAAAATLRAQAAATSAAGGRVMAPIRPLQQQLQQQPSHLSSHDAGEDGFSDYDESSEPLHELPRRRLQSQLPQPMRDPEPQYADGSACVSGSPWSPRPPSGSSSSRGRSLRLPQHQEGADEAARAGSYAGGQGGTHSGQSVAVIGTRAHRTGTPWRAPPPPPHPGHSPSSGDEAGGHDNATCPASKAPSPLPPRDGAPRLIEVDAAALASLQADHAEGLALLNAVTAEAAEQAETIERLEALLAQSQAAAAASAAPASARPAATGTGLSAPPSPARQYRTSEQLPPPSPTARALPPISAVAPAPPPPAAAPSLMPLLLEVRAQRDELVLQLHRSNGQAAVLMAALGQLAALAAAQRPDEGVSVAEQTKASASKTPNSSRAITSRPMSPRASPQAVEVAQAQQRAMSRLALPSGTEVGHGMPPKADPVSSPRTPVDHVKPSSAPAAAAALPSRAGAASVVGRQQASGSAVPASRSAAASAGSFTATTGPRRVPAGTQSVAGAVTSTARSLSSAAGAASGLRVGSAAVAPSWRG